MARVAVRSLPSFCAPRSVRLHDDLGDMERSTLIDAMPEVHRFSAGRALQDHLCVHLDEGIDDVVLAVWGGSNGDVGAPGGVDVVHGRVTVGRQVG